MCKISIFGEYVVINNEGIEVKSYTSHTNTAISLWNIFISLVLILLFRQKCSSLFVKHLEKISTRKPCKCRYGYWCTQLIIITASGYLEESHLPYEMGLVKNQYVARTFIQPTQELREQGVRVKLSAVKDIVEGKRIVLVDDSIVRGTTSKRIVRMLKDSGAKEVHVRIASPEFMFPSFYGIDVSTTL